MLLGAWPAKLPSSPVAGDEEARSCGLALALALASASALSACALEELAVVVAVVSLVALVSERWSLGALRAGTGECSHLDFNIILLRLDKVFDIFWA